MPPGSYRPSSIPGLKKTSIYLIRNEKGEVLNAKLYQHNARSAEFGMSGLLIMDMMRKQILTNSSHVVGAIVFDIVSGKIFIVRCKVTVLAAGHSNDLMLSFNRDTRWIN
jgi:hypothetical protein